jgi:hypothetical protein
MTQLINKTPHVVKLKRIDGTLISLPPVLPTPRLIETSENVGMIWEIPTISRVYLRVKDLPPPRDGVYLIVSNMVRMECPDRQDLVSPGDLSRTDGVVDYAFNLIINKQESE